MGLTTATFTKPLIFNCLQISSVLNPLVNLVVCSDLADDFVDYLFNQIFPDVILALALAGRTTCVAFLQFHSFFTAFLQMMSPKQGVLVNDLYLFGDILRTYMCRPYHRGRTPFRFPVRSGHTTGRQLLSNVLLVSFWFCF